MSRRVQDGRGVEESTGLLLEDRGTIFVPLNQDAFLVFEFED